MAMQAIQMIITGHTKVVGVIGHPVEHSLSPGMHNAEFERLGLDWVYVPFAVHPDRVETALRGIAALGVAGINVTVPHKQAVIRFLDELSPEARRIGAVNTIRFGDDGRSVGFNTDAPGWADDIQQDILLEGSAVCILGAGGASRGLCVAAAMAGSRSISVCNRTFETAVALCESLQPEFPEVLFRPCRMEGDEVREQFRACEIIVNATSVGMASNPGIPVPADWLHQDQYVYDTIYTPAETELLKTARQRGCAARNGLGMLARQGALSFEIWTGHRPDVERMEAAIRRQLAERNGKE